MGGLFAGGLNLALPSIHILEGSWFPIYAFGAAIGIAAGLLASLSFQRTWILGVGATIGLLFGSANVSARLIGSSGFDLNGVEVFLNGALCYVGFAGVLAERVYLAAKKEGKFDEGLDELVGPGAMDIIAYSLVFPGLAFAGAYTGSLPNALAALIN